MMFFTYTLLCITVWNSCMFLCNVLSHILWYYASLRRSKNLSSLFSYPCFHVFVVMCAAMNKCLFGTKILFKLRSSGL